MFIFHAISYLIYILFIKSFISYHLPYTFHVILYFTSCYCSCILSSHSSAMFLILCHIFFTFLLHNILYISFAYTCHFFLCFISANTLEADTGNNCLYPKVLYIPKGIITVQDSDLCTVICDPNGIVNTRRYHHCTRQ